MVVCFLVFISTCRKPAKYGALTKKIKIPLRGKKHKKGKEKVCWDFERKDIQAEFVLRKGTRRGSDREEQNGLAW